tara:strand:+ start:102 stop:380 length:279 start_codon:yes stop_codon:yes gene_type:complete
MDSFLPILAVSTLTGVGLWFWSQYRKAMNRAYRAVQDSQKQVLSNAESEHDRIEVKLVGVSSEIDSLDLSKLATAVDDAFKGADLPPDDANE